MGGGERLLLLVPYLPTQHHRVHAGVGEEWFLWVSGAQGVSRVSGGGLGLGGPCSLSLYHPAHLPLPPAPAWPVQPHKALFMAGGWPGAPEGGCGRRVGSCT